MNPDFHLPDDLGPDSLDVVELVMAYEEAVDEKISEEEMSRIKQLRRTREVVEYLRKRKKGDRPN